MTQPAKVQEPSMEEILASIRRIIADDEARPAGAEKAPGPTAAKLEKPAAVAPAVKAPVMTNIPPSAIPAAQAAAAKAPPAPAKPAPPPAAPPPPAAAPVSNSQDDIDAMLAGLDEATSEAEIRPAAPEVEVFEFTETAAARAVHRRPAFEPPPFESSAPPAQQILSRSTVSAVESAFNSLANTVLSNNARTLEDLVKEMLRPMLKSWLDDNLPGLVERIVKAEIERVSRGR